jgi:shikimate dehydrogenase
LKISGKSKITGIFGSPVRHTLSPAMHNAAFQHLGLDIVYVPFEVSPESLKKAVDGIRGLGLLGVNVTIPHKENVMRFLDRIDPLARAMGSVNTIVNSGGMLTGHNTDARGFLKDLASNNVKIKGETIIVIGAGGAGRAVSSALSFFGAGKMMITDKDERKARALSGNIKNAEFVPFADFTARISEAKIMVNATPIGMHKGDPSPVEAMFLHKNLFVYDVVYNRKTRLLADAQKKGIRHSDGLGMLLHQGALAFELWTKRKAPVEVMRKALRDALKI